MIETDFDKEIDTLLRKAGRERGVPAAADDAGHLDADAISAFASDAVPQPARTMYMRHFADCDECRKFLAQTISIYEEAVPGTAPPHAVHRIAAGLPWYRRIFAVPALAYGTGALVLLFSGFIGYMLLQPSWDAGYNDVSQETETRSGGPSFDGEPPISNASSAMANTATNTAATTSANTNTIAANRAEQVLRKAAGNANSSIPTTTTNVDRVQLDGANAVADSSATGAAPAPPPARLAEVRTEAEADAARLTAGEAKTKNDMAPGTTLSRQDKQAAQGAKRSARDTRFGATSNLKMMGAGASRTVGGKSFQLKQGVWYDSSYQGQATTNVRRGSAEFAKLDGGVRSIANSLSGVVVVVQSGKAYRIQ